MVKLNSIKGIPTKTDSGSNSRSFFTNASIRKLEISFHVIKKSSQIANIFSIFVYGS
jgi:hypothetical protein